MAETDAHAREEPQGRLLSLVLLATVLLVIGVEWHGAMLFVHGASAAVLVFVVLATPLVGWSRRIFVLVGLVLFIAALITRSDWLRIIEAGLESAAFIAAFFSASACLRNASATSPSIAESGRYLAHQPPGRRYAALTAGGHLFGIILLYGAIALLGGLAEASARREANEEVRRVRLRRMVLAIQRGFVSTLCWSPLTFSMAISTTLVPGATWGDAFGFGLIGAVILAGMGWALDTIFKPRLSGPRPPVQRVGTWRSLIPMLILLAILLSTVGGLSAVTGLRAVAVVLVVVPLLAAGWIAMQHLGDLPLRRVVQRAVGYSEDLFNYRSELVLLVMAGFIGTLGARLLLPLMAGSSLDLLAVPAWAILVAIVWIIPLAGLVGMNPILSVSLMAPLLPSAEAIGITPAAIIVAITSGWALSGASSPYTATTLLAGSIGGVSAWRVGLSWNGLYTLLGGLMLSGWVTVVSLL
ncbi:hypothetical protein [Dichotomicrobium thermohalophilum]|uniref:H+/citrate symporter n=1 Tax=Dichotomicrobium thermohalophilum TaxID=933063 RepID=A0A397PEG7_9HYPH|nr:hypothetical protein [Dichotomicrobium thermohalophilum]RIA47348.1 hypothetical protein BXY53_2426 [Dichotomicrobium thermohalophilum]